MKPQPPEDIQDLVPLAASIEDLLNDALELLPDHDRALLVEHYGLDEFGYTSEARPRFRTERGRELALRRARLRFNRALETLLTAELEERRGERNLEEALLLVRGRVA